MRPVSSSGQDARIERSGARASRRLVPDKEPDVARRRVSARSWAWRAAAFAVAAYVGATAFRVYVRNYYLFLPGYVRWELSNDPTPAGGPTHVFFLFTDHFEPDYDAA